MYAKSFLAFDGNGRLTGARTAQTAPYDRYTCHLCGSALRYHPQYDTERPWFEHTDDGLTKHPYPWCVKPAGTADNASTIIMGSGTAHTVIQGVSVRRQWQDERSKNGAGDHAG